MPVTPGVLAILQNIQTVLQTIAQPTYFFDIKASSVVLDPVELISVPTTETPFIVVDQTPGEGTNDFGPATSRPTQLKQDFTVRLLLRVDAPGDDPSRAKTAAWRLYADIETVLTIDVTRGGKCLYTYVHWPSFHYGLVAQQQIYGEIPIRILLNRTYGLP